MNRFADGDPCADSRLSAALTSYCFGGLAEDERQAVEQHLLACNQCWGEFQRLDASVRTLRFDDALKPTLPIVEVVSLLGLSSRLDHPFGGHLTYVLGVATLYGLEWTASLWTELGYSFVRFGTLALTLSLPVFLWVSTALSLGLWFDAEATARGRTNGLLRSISTVFVAALALLGVLMLILPAQPTITASFQTRSAASGYLKNAIFYFLPLLIFVIPTFHTVVRFQHELRAGRGRRTLDFLMRRKQSLSPRGTAYVAPWFLIALLLLAVLIGYQGTNHMLDNLSAGPYSQLFSIALYLRVGLWFAVALTALTWYQSNLNELKRESQALVALDRGGSPSGEQ